MPRTGCWHCFHFLFLLCMLPLSPMLAYLLKDCTITYSENVTAGVSVNCERQKLSSIPDDIPREEVISLTLQKNRIERINRTDFYNMSNLRYLELGFNKITHVDDGAFIHLMELEDLHMQNNKLDTLTDNMFQGLSNLLRLRLNYNMIHFINPVAFQLLTSLQELNLIYNQIHHITDIITILQLPRLQVLNISIELEYFQTKDLPLNMSSELRELRVYSLSIKRFSITTAVFPHLEALDLAHCCNPAGWEWDIPDKHLLRNITKVYFSDSYMYFNNLTKSLQSLDSLEYLQLSYMETWIHRGLLSTACNISTLRTLNLQNNRIDYLSEKLPPCTQLSSVDLSHNGLTKLAEDSIKQMKQLSHLNLAFNRLSKVPDDVKKLVMLQMLNLGHNNIKELSCLDFLNLTRLTHLHLDKNHITALKQCVFQYLVDLKVLTMYHNSIQTFGNAFKIDLQKLEFLDLNRNEFKELMRGDFKSLKSLKHLDVESNKLEQWDSTTFEGLDELETLSLILHVDINMTSSLPHELPLLQSLKSLKIQCNVQSTSPFTYRTFKNTPKLEVLNLSKNKLKSLDFLTLANLTQVSWLDLSQNELTVINVSVFRYLPALRNVNISDNAFACVCSNSDFQQWVLNNNHIQVFGAQRYICASPLSIKGTRFLDFDIHSCWMDDCFFCYISFSSVIVLTLLTTFTYNFLRLYLLYAYYLFLAFLYDAKRRKRGSPQRYDAFISYNVHDELWVYREMLPVLEAEQGWRLCLHHRDFEPGKPIIENITDAIYGSRKTICVISHHYLESEWCSREFQMASYRLFDEKKDVLILVFLEDIPAQRLSPYYRMRRLVKRHTYLSWPQAGQHTGLFWQNLRRALETGDTDLTLFE